MTRSRRKKPLDDDAILDGLASAKRAVKATKHLSAANKLLADAMRAFVESPEVESEASMSAAEVRRWAERFARAADDALAESRAYLDALKRRRDARRRR